MRCQLFLIFILMLLISVLHSNAIPGDSEPKPFFATNKFLVQLTSEAYQLTNLPQELYARADNFGIPELDKFLTELKSTGVLRAHIKANDTDWMQKTGFDRWFIVDVPTGTDILKAIATFQANHNIQQATPEYYLYEQLVPNDTYYPDNWGHNNIRQFRAWTGGDSGSHTGPVVGMLNFDSNAQLAWDYSQAMGTSSIVIAVIDTGFDLSHPDLRFVAGYDFGCNDSGPDFALNNAHGTSCAGIAAARGNNGFGVCGIAAGCSVMPLKIMDSWGYLTSTAINNALVYAADYGADVISMSFGSSDGLWSHTYLDNSLQYAYDRGIPLFAATGNEDASSIVYPAYNNYVISVGAASPSAQRKGPSSSDGEYWWGSNYGVDTQDDPHAVDIMGPTILPTTDIVGGGGYDSGNYEMWFNGTSCATPYVAGVAALLKSRNPSLTPAQVRTALTTTAINMYTAGWDQWTGYGFVDAAAALNSISGGIPFCHITSPVSAHGYTLGSTVTVIANAFDTGGSIDRVEFFLDNATTPAYTDTSSPYTWNWDTTGLTLGAHYLKAKAYDNSGNSNYHIIAATLLNTPTDGFEAAYLNTLPWITSGDADWALQTDEFFSGSKAVRSGTLTTGGTTSTLSLSLNFISGGQYSFMFKVISEVTYDYLRFYVDNVQIAEWSGYHSWLNYIGTVTSGVHEFKWVYTQGGGSVHYGCAILDHLVLPPCSANTYPNIQWSPSSFTQALPVGQYTAQTLYITNWNSPAVTFLAHLPCTTVTVLDETFPTLNTIPAGWSQNNDIGASNWRFMAGGYNSLPPTAYDGAYNARLNNITTTAAVTRLIAPVMDLSNATSASLSFWHTQQTVQTNGQGGLGVYYKTSSGGNWVELTSYTVTYANWTLDVINLPNLSSTYYISFVGAAVSGYCICLDKVVVTKQSYVETSTPWVRFETTNYISGTIGPMSIYTYMVQFSSIGLTPGTYTSNITITSNSYYNPVVNIPITFNVYAATLAAPDSLTIMPNAGRDAVILEWSAPPGFPTRYDIYKALVWDFSDEVLIGSVNTPQTTFTDPSPFSMRKAFYRIRAVRN
jgi:subtilisin family serine protease